MSGFVKEKNTTSVVYIAATKECGYELEYFKSFEEAVECVKKHVHGDNLDIFKRTITTVCEKLDY